MSIGKTVGYVSTEIEKTTIDIRRKFGFFTAEVRLLGLFLLFSHKLRSKAKFC